MKISRETWIGVAVSAVAVAAMAVDHLVGTEEESGEEDAFPVDPVAFVVSVAVALTLAAVLFRFVVPRARGDEAGRRAMKAIAFGVGAVVSVPLLFLAVPFPLAGAAIALGARAPTRAGKAAVALGTAVLVFAVVAYVAAFAT